MRDRASNWLASPFELVGLNIDWDCIVPHCIMGSRAQWEFPPFFQAPVTVPLLSRSGRQMPAVCLPLWLCKGIVEESSQLLSAWCSRCAGTSISAEYLMENTKDNIYRMEPPQLPSHRHLPHAAVIIIATIIQCIHRGCVSGVTIIIPNRITNCQFSHPQTKAISWQYYPFMDNF